MKVKKGRICKKDKVLLNSIVRGTVVFEVKDKEEVVRVFAGIA